METVFKHMAVRLWASFLLGALTALVVLVPLAGTIGPGLMIVPAFLLILAFFWLIGIAFAAMGRQRLNRLIGEATVWERAGMVREARQTLARAEATLYSYYFSPFSRKIPATQLLARLARFQLSQSHPESSSDAVVGTYLRHFPRDREAAKKWLEGILSGRPVTQQSHDIAAKIGSTHADDITIQRMLAQFYIAERCCDFVSLQTYRQLMDSQKPLTDALLNDMADLFIAEQRADHLALEVYVKTYQRGKTNPQLLEAIAACCRLVHPTSLTLPLLEKADTILNDTSPTERKAMAVRFLPDIADRETSPSRRKNRVPRISIAAMVRKAWAEMFRAIGKALSATIFLGRFAVGMLFSKRAKAAIKWAFMGLFSIGVGWLVLSTTLHLAENVKPAEKDPAPVATPINDAFTLQVAAYLKEDDARRYVNQLKKQGVDAYWIRTTGNNRTWYKVRVSHFKNKAEARSMGEELKTRHLIGDYYVANYMRPEVP
jgi:hypothetical protein